MKPPLKRGKLHRNTGNNWSFDGAIGSSEMHDNRCQDNQLFHFTVFSALVFETLHTSVNLSTEQKPGTLNSDSFGKAILNLSLLQLQESLSEISNNIYDH